MTGVVTGKFYPPHRGHKYLIDTARSRVGRLTVIVCDEEGQTIPGALRVAWLREIHPEPNVEIMLIEDVYGADDSAVWAAQTMRWLGHAPTRFFPRRTTARATPA